MEGEGREGIVKRNDMDGNGEAVGRQNFCVFHRGGEGRGGGQHNPPKYSITFFVTLAS